MSFVYRYARHEELAHMVFVVPIVCIGIALTALTDAITEPNT